MDARFRHRFSRALFDKYITNDPSLNTNEFLAIDAAIAHITCCALDVLGHHRERVAIIEVMSALQDKWSLPGILKDTSSLAIAFTRNAAATPEPITELWVACSELALAIGRFHERMNTKEG